MRNLQVLLSEEEHKRLEKRAETEGLPLSVYVRSLLLGDKEALARVTALAPGTEFNLKSLFGTDWTQSRGTKLTLGRTFYEMVRSSAVPTVKALGKDSSNIMQYKRL